MEKDSPFSRCTQVTKAARRDVTARGDGHEIFVRE
jgi:hypothetical protein